MSTFHEPEFATREFGTYNERNIRLSDMSHVVISNYYHYVQIIERENTFITKLRMYILRKYKEILTYHPTDVKEIAFLEYMGLVSDQGGIYRDKGQRDFMGSIEGYVPKNVYVPSLWPEFKKVIDGTLVELRPYLRDNDAVNSELVWGVLEAMAIKIQMSCGPAQG